MFEDFSSKHVLAMLRSAGLTIWVCVLATLFGGIIGLLVGIGMHSKHKVLKTVCKVYVNLLRGIPLLIILFFIYFAIPIVFGLNISQGFASVGGLSIYAGAYIGEIVNGAICAIPKGQFEASEALGMNPVQEYVNVILPQAFRILLPSLVGFIIGLVKDSSLVSVIGYVDLTKEGKIVANLTMQPMITFLYVGLIYFVICFSLSKLENRIEKGINKNGR